MYRNTHIAVVGDSKAVVYQQQTYMPENNSEEKNERKKY